MTGKWPQKWPFLAPKRPLLGSKRSFWGSKKSLLGSLSGHLGWYPFESLFESLLIFGGSGGSRGFPGSQLQCIAVAAIRLRMRMRILARPEDSLANLSHQFIFSNKVNLARLQSEFWPEMFFWGYEISQEKRSGIFPEILSLYLVGPKKPARFPPKFAAISSLKNPIPPRNSSTGRKQNSRELSLRITIHFWDCLLKSFLLADVFSVMVETINNAEIFLWNCFEQLRIWLLLLMAFLVQSAGTGNYFRKTSGSQFK